MSCVNLELPYTKKLFIVYLKFSFNCVFCILSAKPTAHPSNSSKLFSKGQSV